MNKTTYYWDSLDFFFHIVFETWCGFYTCSIFQFSSKFGFSVSIATFEMPNSHMWPVASLLANLETQALVRGTSMQPLLIQKCIADSVVLWVKDDVIQFKWFLDTLTGWCRDRHIFLIFKPPLDVLFVSVFILPGWSLLQGPSHAEWLVPHHGSR